MVVHFSELESRRSIPVRTQTEPGRPDQCWEQVDNNNLIHTRYDLFSVSRSPVVMGLMGDHHI